MTSAGAWRYARWPSFRQENPVKELRKLTGLIEREGDGYVALCPDLDISSQCDSIEEARRNLIEAVELFFETASPAEIQDRLRGELYVTPIEVSIG